MELGNMIFGNSRGEFEIPRHSGYEHELYRLFSVVQGVEYEKVDSYCEPFENDIFSLFPYYWGDCTCGINEENDEEHKPDCLLLKPNFYYKPDGLRIEWYKYPLRDSYSNKKLTMKYFINVIDDCIKSLRKY